MSGDFRFKRFAVCQHDCAMKVGTDGVLVGAWSNLTVDQRRVLDIGTGSGVVALMLAQRSEAWNAHVDAVEIDPQSAAAAASNVAASPWAKRIDVVEADIRSYAAEPYDAIVSNPPFYDTVLLPPDDRRSTARHTTQLGNDELCAAAARLLTPEGRLSIVIPSECFASFVAKASAVGLFCSRLTEVVTRRGGTPRRVLAEFAFTALRTERATLEILDAEGCYTSTYRTLTADFYLDF